MFFSYFFLYLLNYFFTAQVAVEDPKVIDLSTLRKYLVLEEGRKKKQAHAAAQRKKKGTSPDEGKVRNV